MKKTVFILLVALSFAALAQAEVYKSKMVVDHYGDVVSYSECRAIVKETDSTFVIDEKGKELVVYQKVTLLSTDGSREKLDDLTGKSVYGYQSNYLVIAPDGSAKLINDRMISKYKYTFEFDRHMFIIRDVEITKDNVEVKESYLTYATDYDEQIAYYFDTKK